MMFDARDLCRAWLAVAHASGTDGAYPALCRTVLVEQHAGGVRVVATDATVLLHAWAPAIDGDTDPPEIDEAPIRTAIAHDPHGRGKGFLAHALRLATAGDDPPKIDVRLRLDVADDEDDDTPTLPGLEARFAVLEMPDVERVRLQTIEGAYPTWRKLLDAWTGVPTVQIALAPDVVARLAKVGKLFPFASIGWSFGGESRAARVVILESDPHVSGVVMPCRWDIERNLPAEVVEEAERIAREAAEADEGDDE